MNGHDPRPVQTAVLPELEHLLVRVARRRSAPRVARRRWVIAAAAASLVFVTGVAAAATGVFQIADGETSGGDFTIESRVVPAAEPGAPQSSICLQLRFSDRGTAYGCGERPSAARPFGLVIADPLDNGEEQVVYGLVSSEIARVGVLGDGSATDVATGEKPDLPGRFFSAVVPSDSQVELVGYGVDGEQVARLGSLESAHSRPDSRAEAMAQGDPAGFAPTAEPADRYVYKGEDIEPSAATRLGLVCLEGGRVTRCFDSVEEMEAAQGR
jgi:hypothetical protein